MALAAPLNTKNRSLPDAALQVIEVPTADRLHAIALYVDTAAYRAALANPSLQDRGVYSWELKTPLSTLMGEGNQLLAQVLLARKSNSYAGVAKELAQRLFPPPYEHGPPQWQAAQSLARLSGEKAPVVLVRAMTPRNEPIYLPLGLLSARGANMMVQRPIVVQALPRERYARACIDRWSLAIPSEIDGVDGSIVLGPLPPRMSRIDTMDRLEAFLNPRAGPQEANPFAAVPAAAPAASAALPGAPAGQARRSEALLVLAHQGGGALWFRKDSGEELTREEHQRGFPAGSVAVLAACSATSPQGDNQLVLRLLNGRGIDTIVASPFPIEADWGLTLSQEFVVAVRAAYAAGQNPTVLDLYERAVKATIDRFGAQAPSRDKALEFMILGDHELRLCSN